MVAYSFQRQFVAPIRTGTKDQTIRGPRRRHARPGEAMQLYAGMRTRHCEKIIPDPVCKAVVPIRIDFRPTESESTIQVDGVILVRAAREVFALQDGFESLAAMQAFWLTHHGPGPFHGFVITWTTEASRG